ncbi:hypothetical protein RJ639_043509 [Escallonia herrerae]|uniref:Transmembrane protein n=1 Tax=Escallonia herrerae TaxID=1293975 RepID=A0AA88W975_9ASTE|nr:hypothetical protein RJ639_043509 [Escallonia herrerae]
MGHMDSIGSDLDIDLETGGNTSEEDGSKDLSLRSERALYLLNRTWSGSEGFNGAARGGDGLSLYGEGSSGQISAENLMMSSKELGDEMANLLQKKWAKEKRRKLNSEKPPKPPRPPGGPLLDAADMMLVKEISELTMMKRQRTARMKALKKVKAEKKKSSLSNVFAMIVTVLFCLVIIFQVRRDGGNRPIIRGSVAKVFWVLVHNKQTSAVKTRDTVGSSSTASSCGYAKAAIGANIVPFKSLSACITVEPSSGFFKYGI